MFEMAVDYVRQNTDFEIVAGYLSPVSDQYKKPGLLSGAHRVNMCTLAAEETSSWLMVDPWEAFQSYQRTAVVLDHFDYEINTVLGGVQTPDGARRSVRVMLLAGSDLISTMSEPGVWTEADNDVSSTKVRLFLRRGLSVRYLIPAPVVAYIEENGLYLDEDKEKEGKGKGRDWERERERVGVSGKVAAPALA
ncbi:hypothetical protein EW146_g1931 [Bondarzewia mesenterica]|uniref:Cytidyltransferase-like domain-containing protein n=1 Tax=Bondarzewia mesenterica TaxID=1095465 RepID=A0A4S4M2D9_9AGAM|nr:hypothetical protein EW146_g1931 [Bondarzewia mesenterica]